MNKKIITGLITMMGISILAIIIIQLVWMNNAIHVRSELFDREVNEALNSTSNRLENMQDFETINHFAFKGQQPFIPGGHIPPPPHRPHHLSKAFQISRHEGPAPRNIKMVVHSNRTNKGISYQITTKGEAKNANTNSLVIINTDSLIQNLDSAYAEGFNRIDSIVGRFSLDDDSLSEIKSRFEIKTGKLKKLANKVVDEITYWNDDEISTTHVSEILTKELENRSVPIPFEFGIINDSIISKKTENADSTLLLTSNYKVNLFPNDIFQKNIRLSVYFPGKSSFIYKTLNWLLLISLLISIIVLVSFGFSIHFILKQKKISEMKSDFINNMTHEFKTPIATISVAADSVINQKVIENPEKIRYFMEMIKKENTRMNRQVEDILTIARLDKKEFEFRWEAINIHQIIEDAIQSIELQVEKKGGSITCELLASIPIATSDSTHFANLIYNLLDNANKYSSNAPEIKISTQNTKSGIIIQVEDKGIGMTKSVQSRIFERFYRQTSGNIHNVKGFGLGLSYVKAVLEANHGSINVHSEPGKGSRFDVFIPFVRES